MDLLLPVLLGWQEDGWPGCPTGGNKRISKAPELAHDRATGRENEKERDYERGVKSGMNVTTISFD